MLLRPLTILSIIIISTACIAADQQPFPPQLLGSVKLLKDVLTLQSPTEARWHPGWGWLSAPQDQATKESAIQWVIPGWGWLGGWASPQEKSIPWNGFPSGVYEQWKEYHHGKKAIAQNKESGLSWVVPGVDWRGNTDEKAIPWWAYPGDLNQLWEQQKGKSVQQKDSSSECPSECLPCWFPTSSLSEKMVACNNREVCNEVRQKCSPRRHLTAVNPESFIGQQLSTLAALYLDTTTAIAKSADSDETKKALTEAVGQIYDSIVSNLNEQIEQSSPGFLRPSQRSIDRPVNFIAPCWWPADRLTEEQAKCRSEGSCAHARCEPTKDQKYIRLADMYTSTLQAIAGSNAQTFEQKNGLANAIDYIFDTVVASEAKKAAKEGSIQEAAMCWPDWFPDWMLNKEEQQARRRPPCVSSRSIASKVPKDTEMGEVLTSIGELYRKTRSLINDPVAFTTIPGNIRGQLKMAIDGVFDKAVRDAKGRQGAQQV